MFQWAELVNKSGRPMLIENCHQGGFDPGMKQWQTYLKNTSTGEYAHKLGYLRVGDDAVPPAANVSFVDCKTGCDTNANCSGFCFESDLPAPPAGGLVAMCYWKAKKGLHFNSMDLSQSGHCLGTTAVSDCPYSLYRTSGDIGPSWLSMLNNLALTVPFLSKSAPKSRPGGWAYPE